MTDPERALAVLRFTHDAATLLVWGAYAYLAALVPRPLATEIEAKLSVAWMSAVAVAVVTTFAALPLEAAVIGDGWSDTADPATVRAVLFETSVGHTWQVQAAAALLLALAWLVPGGVRQGAVALGAGLLLATLCLTGHAAMHEGWLGVVHLLNDAFHVLAAGAWVGALAPLVPTLGALDDPARRQDAGVALRRFSTAGHVAVALVVVTGVANTALVLGRWPTDWSSPYQALLAVKIAIVLTMVMLAVYNRYVLVPRIPRTRERATRALRTLTITEVGLGLAAVACVSVFGLLEPA